MSDKDADLMVSRVLAVLVARAGGKVEIPKAELDAYLAEDGELLIASNAGRQVLIITAKKIPQADPRARMREILRTSTASLKKLKLVADRIKDARETYDVSERLALLTAAEKQKLDDDVDAVMGSLTGGRS